MMEVDKATRWSLGAWLLMCVAISLTKVQWSVVYQDKNLQAWAQAFGGAGTIAVTFFVARYQALRQERARRTEVLLAQADQIEAVAEVCGMCAHVIDNVGLTHSSLEEFRDSGCARLVKLLSAVEEIDGQLRGVSVYQLPPSIVGNTITFLAAFGHFKRNVRNLIEGQADMTTLEYENTMQAIRSNGSTVRNVRRKILDVLMRKAS
ncbi:MAG: hypothetical protein JO006_16905 [Paucibacter sp.]|nr:hypothetical protein [Roseateles sp.]